MNEMTTFYIHYDVDEHFIPMDAFLVAAQSTQKILDDLNKQIFGNQFRYKLIVLPPEDGTFLKKVGIVALAGAVYISQPIVSDYALGAFKGLTNKTPYEYGESHFIALKDTAQGFYSKTVDELEEIIPKELNLDKAFKAKTDFYNSCRGIESLRAIGFDNTKNFPIIRSDFSKHITQDKSKPLESDYCIYEAVIVSPVDIDKDSKWEFLDKKHNKKISAHMRDEEFKRDFLDGKHPLKTLGVDDEVKILVEYKKELKNGEIKENGTFVKDVYILNDKILKNIPSQFDYPVNTSFIAPIILPMDKMGWL